MQTAADFAQANSLDWQYADSIIYLNLRHTNTFYKINQTTGDKSVSSLWYHSHNTKEVSHDVFTIFDNDIDNVTNPYDCYSRMIEVTLNEEKHDCICKLELGSSKAILESLWRPNPNSSKRRHHRRFRRSIASISTK